MADHDDDLATSKTAGFKIAEKKTVEEYHELDKNDESLQRWKASLGLGSGTPIADPNDPRTCIIKSLALEVAGRPDITIDLSASGAVDNLKNTPFTIKEGSKFRIKATFQVQHDVLSGLKYIQVVKRKGVRVSKDQLMLVSVNPVFFGPGELKEMSNVNNLIQGSYAPSTTDRPVYEKKFIEEEAPSGMLARGSYNATSRFVDDDDHDHLRFDWSFVIAKDW
ncbi:hypothetical protein FQN57_003201 [Myotisia sp. PD_48]|nr:hypothetical protein FQN57_003201 [Myotisia sp. PD_48]